MMTIPHNTKRFQMGGISVRMKMKRILFVSIDIILMASNSSNFYVLKYNIKHALEESEHSSTQSLTSGEEILDFWVKLRGHLDEHL